MTRNDKEKPKPPAPVELTDLRHLCRNSDTLRTEVELHYDHDLRFKWLVLGACDLRKSENSHDRVLRWWLDAKMGTTTDFEHDTASVIRLPLVAVSIGLVYHNRVRFNALVEPRIDKRWNPDFHVPRPGYDPPRDPCESPYCKEKGNEHLMVNEGFYVPPFDEELYAAVAGVPVDIYMGEVYNNDEAA